MDRGIGWRPAVAATAIALGLAVTACGSSATSSSGGGAGGGTTVTAKNIAFNPTSITVAANAQVTITFVNQDSVTHSLTFDSDSSKSVEAPGGSTQTLSFTAPAAGAMIAFHCNFHSSMHGSISVGGSGGGAAAPGSSSTTTSGGYGY
jgi:plastocyanin